jgi:hypothetical protein
VADEEEEAREHRVDFFISAYTYRYLAAIKARRAHGGTVTAVIRRLIDDGIQSAIDREYIELQQDDSTPTGKAPTRVD